MTTRPAHDTLHLQLRAALAEPGAPEHTSWSVARARFVDWVLLGTRPGEAWSGFRQGAAAWAALARLCPTSVQCEALQGGEEDGDRCLLKPTTGDRDLEPEESALKLTTKPYQGPSDGFAWSTDSDDEPLPDPTGEYLAPAVSVKQLLLAVKRQAEAPPVRPTREDAERLRLLLGAVELHGLFSYPNFIAPFAHFLANAEFGDDTNFERLEHPPECEALFPDHTPEELFWPLYAALITGGLMYTSGEPASVPLLDEQAQPEAWLAAPVLPPPPLFTSEAALRELLASKHPKASEPPSRKRSRR